MCPSGVPHSGKTPKGHRRPAQRFEPGEEIIVTHGHALGLGAALISMVAIAACGATQPGPRGSTAPVPSPALTTPRLTASSPAPSSGSDADTPVCRTPRLRITLARSAAAGPIVGGYMGFINQSGTACHLTGWPALVADRKSVV